MALSPDAIAVDYILRRVQLDGRLAYLLGDTEAVRLLVTAQATREGDEPIAAVRKFNSALRPERVIPVA